MRQHWFGLTPDGWHDVVMGLLRDGQLELALEKFESMQGDGMRIETWLYEIIIYTLLDHEEMDEALRIFKARIAMNSSTVGPNLWYHLLDRSSRALHVGDP